MRVTLKPQPESWRLRLDDDWPNIFAPLGYGGGELSTLPYGNPTNKVTTTYLRNVYVDNLDEFGKMNAVYAKYFGALPPTRTTVSPLAPVERKRNANGTYPKLEEVAIVAVKAAR